MRRPSSRRCRRHTIGSRWSINGSGRKDLAAKELEDVSPAHGRVGRRQAMTVTTRFASSGAVNRRMFLQSLFVTERGRTRSRRCSGAGAGRASPDRLDHPDQQAGSLQPEGDGVQSDPRARSEDLGAHDRRRRRPGVTLKAGDLDKLPRVEQSSRLKCVQCWSGRVNWEGFRGADLLRLIRREDRPAVGPGRLRGQATTTS